MRLIAQCTLCNEDYDIDELDDQVVCENCQYGILLEHVLDTSLYLYELIHGDAPVGPIEAANEEWEDAVKDFIAWRELKEG